MRRREVRRLAWVLVGSLMLAALPGSATAGHDLRGQHWAREGSEFTVEIGNNVNGEWDAILRRSAADWSRSDVLDLKVVGGKTNRQSCRPTKGRIEVCNGFYGDTGWLGVAGLWTRDKHITQAVVLINESYFAEASFDDGRVKRHVMCQEIGHALGLDHVKGATCMDDRQGLFSVGAVDPNGKDYQELERVYDHVDERTTVERASAPGAVNAASSSEFPIPGPGDEELVVEDLGGGDRLITHITRVSR